jgi:hypothetical protein
MVRGSAANEKHWQRLEFGVRFSRPARRPIRIGEIRHVRAVSVGPRNHRDNILGFRWEGGFDGVFGRGWEPFACGSFGRHGQDFARRRFGDLGIGGFALV